MEGRAVSERRVDLSGSIRAAARKDVDLDRSQERLGRIRMLREYCLAPHDDKVVANHVPRRTDDVFEFVAFHPSMRRSTASERCRRSCSESAPANGEV